MELGSFGRNPSADQTITTLVWDLTVSSILGKMWAVGVFAFCCPNTGDEIDPGIEGVEAGQTGTDGVRFAALYVRCPHCGEHHEIKIDDDALIEAA
jgi:phage terminase large subunit GpA-like protein